MRRSLAHRVISLGQKTRGTRRPVRRLTLS